MIRATGIVAAAHKFGIRTDETALDTYERQGRVKLPPTPAAIEAVDTVWGWLRDLELTNGKLKPTVGCFKDIMEGGTRMLGFTDGDGVFFADDHATGITNMVLKTALEECTHWITGATDNSRDFQDFLLRALVQICV